MLRRIAAIAIGVDGHRADLVIARTATTIAAYEGRTEVTPDDLRRAAELALPHRMRRTPFSDQSFDPQRLQDVLDRDDEPEPPSNAMDGDPGDQPDRGMSRTAISPINPLPSVHRAPHLTFSPDRQARAGNGRRTQTIANDTRGRSIGATVLTAPTGDIAIGATVCAASQHAPDPVSTTAVSVTLDDLRRHVRRTTVGGAILFVVDTSGSMGASSALKRPRARR